MDRPYPSDDTAVVRNAVGGFELLFNLFNQELQIFRGHVRDVRERVLAFFGENAKWKQEYTDALISLAARANNDVYLEFGQKTEEREKERTYVVPSTTFNDVEKVLLTDDACEGVLFDYMLRCPKWKSLPERVVAPKDFDVSSEFQLWNRPLSMTADEEEERLSLPSTRYTAGEWEGERTSSVEAQLAMLTRQMQLLLQAQAAQQPGLLGNFSPSSNASRSGSRSVSPSDESEDEGRGTSLNSPSATLKKSPNSIAKVAPPPGPPPPPPPANILKPIENRIVINKTEHRAGDHEEVRSNLPNRPTMADLKAVQLKKVDSARSPGGTPFPKSRLRSTIKSTDQGGMLAAALKDKFRTIQNSFSEHEDAEEVTWMDED